MIWIVSGLALMCALASPARADWDFLDVAQRDIARLGLDKRWAIVSISVIDATGQGIEPLTISGPLHAAMVINSSYGWPGERWKFLPFPSTSSGASVHVLAGLYNFTENVTNEVLERIAGVLMKQSIIVQLYVIVTPGTEFEYILIGGYRKASGRRAPVFRMYSGDIERGADEILRLAQDAM